MLSCCPVICANFDAILESIEIRDRLQISSLVLSELINFYYPWNHQKTHGFLMISRVIEVKLLKMRLILGTKFAATP